MKKLILIFYFLLFLVSNSCFTQVIWVGPMYITSNTVWSPSNPAPSFNSDLIVTCNNTLTIDNQIISLTKSSIIVQPGANLILRNSTLTGGYSVSSTGNIVAVNWYGIKLWGRLSSYRSIIENADIGVWVRNEDNYIPDNTGTPYQGYPTETFCTSSQPINLKINAFQTTFNDNGLCVFFDNYYNKSCNFNYCDFLSTNPLRSNVNFWLNNWIPYQNPQNVNNDYWPVALVYGLSSGNERFVGCLFKGPSMPLLSSNPKIIGLQYEFNFDDRPKNIKVTSEDLINYNPLINGVPWRPSKFENLITGLSAKNEDKISNFNRQLTVSKSVFNDVATGIYTSDIDGLKLQCNNFNAIQYDNATMNTVDYINLAEDFIPGSGGHLKYTSLNLKGGSCFAFIKDGWGFNIDGNQITWPVKYTSFLTFDLQKFKTYMNLNSGCGIIVNNDLNINTIGNTISNNTFSASLVLNEPNKNIIGLGVIGAYQNCEVSCNEFNNLGFDWFLFSTKLSGSTYPLTQNNPPSGSTDIARNLSNQGTTNGGNNNTFSLLDGSPTYIYDQNIFCNFELDFKYYCFPNNIHQRTEPIIRSEWIFHDNFTGDMFFYEYYLSGFNPLGCNYTYYDLILQQYFTWIWSIPDPNIPGNYIDLFSSNFTKVASQEKSCSFDCIEQIELGEPPIGDPQDVH